MGVLQSECLAGFARLCEDGYVQGWHEANGGNLSYRMTASDVAECRADFSCGRSWTHMGVQADNLAGAYFLVTGAGQFLHNVTLRPSQCTGILQIDDAGDAWRIIWGLEGGGRPTSEFPTHFMNHSIRMRVSDGADRVIYHAHCPNVITLSTLVAPDARTWTRILWKSMTECVLVFPQGVGVVPWMVPGGDDIARATAELIGCHDAVVWTQHGMFVAGESFDAAFGMMHVIEKSAGLYLAARATNGGREPDYLISDEQLCSVCEANGVNPNMGYLDDGSLINGRCGVA